MFLPVYGGPTTRLANHFPDKAETAAAVSAYTGIPNIPNILSILSIHV